jgi:hypothetical protein
MFCLLCLPCAVVAQTAPAKPVNQILSPNSMWRMCWTWQTDVCRSESGALVRVDWNARLVENASNQWVSMGYDPIVRNGVYRLQPARRIDGSAGPPDGWQQPDFDDGLWENYRGPVKQGYRCLALLSLRGRFEVKDPAQASDMSVSLTYRGGVVAYVNGQELGRAHIPKGPLAPGALADDYPADAYLDANGNPVRQISWYYPTWNNYQTAWGNNKDYEEMIRKRTRTATFAIPSSLLRRGVNVLAIEIHRAPAPEAMFLKSIMLDPSVKYYGSVRAQRSGVWWDRCSLEDVRVTTAANADTVVPNVARAKGLHIATPGSYEVNDLASYYADPNETLRPIRLCGLRNGAYCGQLVVDSSAPIKGLKAVASDLTGTSGAIPAACVKLGYNEWDVEWMQTDWGGPHHPFRGKVEDHPLDEIPLEKARDGSTGALQPVSVIVTVPKTARPGKYTGKIRIVADGETPVEVPIEMEVAGNWVLPDARDFWLYMSFVQSPDTLAMEYGVPMWSEAHWKLIERSFELLGQIGNKEVVIPLISETHAGNAHTMAYWVRQPDGSYTVDWTHVERYLDLAVKHMGRIPDVCFIITYGFYSNWSRPHAQLFTVKDPATGELKEEIAPDWGTPAALAFWTPVAAHIRQMLKTRGLENSLTFWNTQFSFGKKEAWDDLRKLLPEARYIGRSHLCWQANPKGNWLTVSWKDTAAGVLWDPDEDAPWYNWRTPGVYVLHFNGADILGRSTAPSILFWGGLSGYRMTPEMTLLTGVAGQNAHPGVMEIYAKRGIGQCGADFWPVLKNAKGEKKGNLLDQYCNEMQHPIFWPCILGAGREGPVTTLRTQMLREGLQDAEARMFVQNALLDHADKLGPALAGKVKAVCDERTRSFRYTTEYLTALSRMEIQDQARRLYAVADEVAKVLGDQPR